MASGDKETPPAKATKECRIPNPSCAIRRIVALMQNPMSMKYVDRQLDLIDGYISGSQWGIWVTDLPYVTDLLEMLMERLQDGFECCFKAILELYGMPPLLHQFTEVLHTMNDIVQYFTFYGHIIVNSKELRFKLLAFKSLDKVLERKRNPPQCAISIKVIHEALERSDLPKILAILIEIGDQTYFSEVLHSITTMADVSKEICWNIINENAIGNLLHKLLPAWVDAEEVHDFDIKQAPYLQPVTHLLRILLKAYQSASEEFKKRTITPSCEEMILMKVALRLLVVKGLKSDRNYYFVVLLLLADCFPDVNLVKSGIVKDVCILSVASELGSGGTWASQVKFECVPEDYEFKKLLLLAVYYSVNQFAGDDVIKEQHVIMGLLKLITPSLQRDWGAQHLCELRLSALVVLERLIPLLHQDLINKNGVVRLLMLVDYYPTKPYSLKTLIAALKCIYQILMCQSAKIYGNYEELSIMGTMRHIVTFIVNQESLGTDNQTALLHAFSIMSRICPKSSDPSLEQDITLSLQYMRRCLNLQEGDMRYDPKAMVCVLHYLWSLCSYDDEITQNFVEQKGIYTLLNVINEAIFPVQVVGLGFLTEMCEVGSCVSYLVTWRCGKLDAMALMLRIFREECALIGVKLDSRGLIEDTKFPIMGAKQKSALMLLTDDETSLTITDMECSCRPKIYAITQLLQNRHEQALEITKQYYKIYDCNLDTRDQITKILSENYLALKIGEAWQELKAILDASKLTPTYYDQHMLSTIIGHYEHWGLEIHNMQKACLQIEYNNEYFNEENFYNLLRESKLQGALDALLELDYIARTTEAMFRTKLIGKVKYSTDVHPTRFRDTDVSDPIGQKITLQSDIIDDPYREIPPVPISPISSLVEFGDGVCMDTDSVDVEVEQKCYIKAVKEVKKCHY